MKCISCEVQIDPKWKHAIDINVCPFCGESIMEEKLKSLFSSLRSTMQELQEYSDQLNDWMLSNHNYIKTDALDLKIYLPKDYKEEIKRERDIELAARKREEDLAKQDKRHIVKVVNEHGEEEEVLVEKKMEDEKTGDFFKRTDFGKPKINGKVTTVAAKTQHLKDVVQQIKRAGAPVVNASGNAELISPEMMESADPEAIAEMQSILSGNESVSSSLQDTGDGDDDPPAFVVQALQNRAKGNNGPGSNTADLMKHQKLYDGINNSKKNFNSGGGGFSRA
jgi:hypothetical protein